MHLSSFRCFVSLTVTQWMPCLFLNFKLAIMKYKQPKYYLLAVIIAIIASLLAMRCDAQRGGYTKQQLYDSAIKYTNKSKAYSKQADACYTQILNVRFSKKRKAYRDQMLDLLKAYEIAKSAADDIAWKWWDAYLDVVAQEEGSSSKTHQYEKSFVIVARCVPISRVRVGRTLSWHKW